MECFGSGRSRRLHGDALRPVTTAAESPPDRPAATVHRGELIAFPGPWGFLPRSGIILVSDEELETLANDPDQKINMATTFTPRNESLRHVCERAKKRGRERLSSLSIISSANIGPGRTNRVASPRTCPSISR